MIDFIAPFRTRLVALAALAAVLCVPVVGRAAPADDDLANDPVDQAIKKAVGYLYRTQKAGSNWENVQTPPKDLDKHGTEGTQWGGLSAMATYALLAAGENPQDPRVANSINWLTSKDHPIAGTYAMGMKLQIYNYIRKLTEDQKKSLRTDATLLLQAVKTGNNNLGLYHYWLDPMKGNYDHSCSNYGVLGMWAAAMQNLEVPTKYWETVDAAWRKGQDKSGGWGYTRNFDDKHPVTMSMTSAGVATLFITQEQIFAAKGLTDKCTGNIDDKDIERGIQWMAQNYKKGLSGGHGLYSMYNVERVGTASGLKYFDTVDWYKDGAAHLVKTQGADGGWGGIPNTVWGILFLVKGRAPVMMNKLAYASNLAGDKGKEGNWNQRPRDLANLARWTGKSLEKEVNWQIVNLKVDIDDLHDAPILYISGSEPVNFTKEEKAKLKQYVEQGGMILGHADCNSQRFSLSFTKLGQELFPQSEFRDLPADHLIYNCHFSRKSKDWAGFNPTLRGLTNGARELMVLIPNGDPARYFHIQNFSSGQTRPMAEMVVNIYLYAVDKDSLKGKFKGQTYIVERDEKVKADRTAKVARVEYAGNWNPEPGGWRRFANLMHNTRKLDLEVEQVKLGDGKLNAAAYKLAHLTGTVKFKLSAAQQAELKKYVEDGGTLVVDAAGGSFDFKDSVESELTTTFGAAARQMVGAPLPLSHPVYAAGGDKLTRLTYRAFARKTLVSGLSMPRLRGMEVNNRTAVYYSPEDLSVGLVGMTVDGVYGYDPRWSNKLMENIVLHALGVAPKVAAGAPPQAAAGGAAPKKEEPKKEAPKAAPGGGGKPPAAPAAKPVAPAARK